MNIRCFFQTRLSAILFNKRIVQPSICFETRGRVFQAFGRAFKADLGFTIVNNIALVITSLIYVKLQMKNWTLKD